MERNINMLNDVGKKPPKYSENNEVIGTELKERLNILKILYIDRKKPPTAFIKGVSPAKISTVKPENAASRFRKYRHDIVIAHLDILIDLAEQLRNVEYHALIVAVINENNTSTELKAVEKFVELFIFSPFNIEKVRKMFDKLSMIVLGQKGYRERQRIITSLIDINPSLIAVFGNDGLTYLNQSFERYFDVSSILEFREVYGEFVSCILNRPPHLLSDTDILPWAKEIAKSTEPCLIQIKIPRETEVSSFLVNSVHRNIFRNEYILSFTDITFLEKERAHYQFLAEYDGLTRIYNRRKIDSELEREIMRSLRYKEPLSLLMIDIDNFKFVNDIYGHQAGDVVLIEMAGIISERVRKTDIPGRYGGEEFLVIMPSTNVDYAFEIAERLRLFVEKYNFTKAGRVTCSIGVTSFKNNESIVSLLKRADDALYAAKHNGRNRTEKVL
jgi:diguanylate cyclase (GGDEF)-like protein